MASLRLPSYASLPPVEVYKAQLKSYLSEGGYWRCVTEEAAVATAELEVEAAKERQVASKWHQITSRICSANHSRKRVEQGSEASEIDLGQEVEQSPSILDTHECRGVLQEEIPGPWDCVLGHSVANAVVHTRYVSEAGWAIPLHYVWETRPPTPPANYFRAPATTVVYDVPMQMLNTALENVVAFKESLTWWEAGPEIIAQTDQSSQIPPYTVIF